MNPTDIDANAHEVAAVMRALAHASRLQVLCALIEAEEATAGMLVDYVGLSQSALSQHLAKMREEGLIDYRRDKQTLWYRIADPRVHELMATLHRLYCRRK